MIFEASMKGGEDREPQKGGDGYDGGRERRKDPTMGSGLWEVTQEEAGCRDREKGEDLFE